MLDRHGPGGPGGRRRPDDLRVLTRPGGGYETYYSSHPAASFAAQVWANNAGPA